MTKELAKLLRELERERATVTENFYTEPGDLARLEREDQPREVRRGQPQKGKSTTIKKGKTIQK